MSGSKRPEGFEVLNRQDFSDVTYSLVIRHPRMAKAARPGQFVIVMLHDTSERIGYLPARCRSIFIITSGEGLTFTSISNSETGWEALTFKDQNAKGSPDGGAQV
jgi:NAD(P)H-flavin reductase